MTVEDLKQMQKKLLFNPRGNDDLKGRRIIGGETTNLFNLNNDKSILNIPVTIWGTKCPSSAITNSLLPKYGENLAFIIVKKYA